VEGTFLSQRCGTSSLGIDTYEAPIKVNVFLSKGSDGGPASPQDGSTDAMLCSATEVSGIGGTCKWCFCFLFFLSVALTLVSVKIVTFVSI
jgi:hypothetical protein